MSNKSKLKIALIGLGSIAQKAYLPILANHPKVKPVLCTRNTDTLNSLSKQYRIKNIYSRLIDIIATKPDAAMVHSSTNSHPEIVSKLLQSGIPVFVDKPLSYKLEESEKLLALASKKKLPVYVGFNRRFAPLIKLLSQKANPLQIHWQKNRTNLPDDPRVFILDDFIHVVDGLRFLGKGKIKNLKVHSRVKNNKLENIQIHWQQGDTFLSGGMNRISGITEEKIEYFTQGNKWTIDSLNSGIHFSDEKENNLKFNNWETTLYKRGFVDMIDDWISVVEEKKFSAEVIDDILKTHQLCEEILSIVLKN